MPVQTRESSALVLSMHLAHPKVAQDTFDQCHFVRHECKFEDETLKRTEFRFSKGILESQSRTISSE